MSTERRDTLAILANMLENMQEPSRITHLLHASNLSYSQFSKYLKMIIQMGLAQEQKQQYHQFTITDDGKFFVSLVKKRMEKEKSICYIQLKS